MYVGYCIMILKHRKKIRGGKAAQMNIYKKEIYIKAKL